MLSNLSDFNQIKRSMPFVFSQIVVENLSHAEDEQRTFELKPF